MAADHLDLYTIPFLLVTILSYCLVFYWQYRRLDNELNRLIILSTRLALFLPLYGIIIYISLAVPVLYLALTVPTALIEGYSFYCFFVLMVTNLGGPNETINYLSTSGKPLLFYWCCPNSKKRFYKQACWNVWNFVCTRVGVVLISVICAYINNATGRPLFRLLTVLFTLIALIQLVQGIASVVNLYEDVYGHLKNINGVLKALLLKISVGLITLQGIAVTFMTTVGGNPYEATSRYSSAYVLQRYYCALVLAEFSLVSLVYLHAYGRPLTAPETPYLKYVIAKGGTGMKIQPSLGWFLCEVLSLSDVFRVLTPEARDSEEPTGTDPEQQMQQLQ